MPNDVVECFRCHTPIPENSRYCSSCGADVSGGGQTGTANVDLIVERLRRIVEGKYRIERLLGKGGMGAVFLAHDLTLEREVAIKVLPPDIAQDEQVVRRFHQEAKTAAKLDHPNIIPIYRVESEGGLNYFVMKYISGTSLEDVLEKKQPLPVPEIQRILWEAACALGHAHQRGVVHRDVKPANIMFDHDDRVMLTDFGISKALQAATGFTATGMIIGTPHYMAPEQGKGAAVDGRADQYSLGVVGYRMITAELPFGGDSVHTIIYKHIYEEPPLVSTKRPGIPAALTAAIARGLSKEPELRFPTMEDFATAVWPEQPVASPTRAPVTGRSRPRPGADAPTEIASAPTTPITGVRTGKQPARPRPAPRKSRAGLVVGVVVLVAAAAGGAYWLLGRTGAGDSAAVPGAPTPPGGEDGEIVAGLEITGAPAALAPGEQAALVAHVKNSTGAEVANAHVTWSSSDSTVALVAADGVLHGVAAGTASLSASSGGKSASVKVTVRATAPTAGGPAPVAVTPRRTPRPKPQSPAPPATAAPEPQGLVTINADPFGEVYVDGVDAGQTPLIEYQVKPGRHTIRIEHAGFKTVTETVQVDANTTVRKRYTLLPE